MTTSFIHPLPALSEAVAAQPYPLLFMSVSGAHLYGFPSPDSDYDLRGVHILPLREVAGLYPPTDTVEDASVTGEITLDLVTHDVTKFFGLMLKRNGYVLEQLLSPLVLHTSPFHSELIALAPTCLTRHHAYHYLGFAQTQWRLFQKEQRVKPLLYVYRVLLTGIYLMQTGEVRANLVQLNDHFNLPYLPELIDRKTSGTETGLLADADMAFHGREYARLKAMLKEARDASPLPETTQCKPALNDLLLRVRGLR